MARGILGTIGLATTLVFALPLAGAGVEFLRRGDLALGLALIGVGVAMVLVHEYITTPGDLPTLIASKLTSKAVGEPENDD